MYLPNVPPRVYDQMARMMIFEGAKKVTKILSEKLTVKMTRRLYGGKIDGRERRIDIVLTIGVPNFAERQFIKKAKKAREPFPVKRLLFEWLKRKEVKRENRKA